MVDEIERVRAYREDVPEPDAVRVNAARAELMEAMRPEPLAAASPRNARPRMRTPQRRRRCALAGGVAIVALAVVGVLGFKGSGFKPSPALAATMDKLARIVPSQDWSGVPIGGQYLYTKSVMASISGSGVPQVVRRQSWIASDGSDLVNSSAVPDSGADTITKIPAPPNGSYFPTTIDGWKALSTDPATLLQQIHKLDGGPPTLPEEFVNITDALRETSVPPAIRAALYQALGRIHGVKLLGPQTDPVGQSGLGVEYQATHPTDPDIPTTELIFDQQTGRMLAEESYNQSGQLSGWTSYLEQEIVSRAPAVGTTTPPTSFPQIQTSNLSEPSLPAGPAVTVSTPASGTPVTVTGSSPTPTTSPTP